MNQSLKLLISNLTIRSQIDDSYESIDDFPSSSYEDETFDSSSISINRSFYDDFSSQFTQISTKNSTTFSLTLSSPFTYLISILVVYILLTIILLSFSLYKQRQTEVENFYFGDTDEEIEQTKRSVVWKQFLIGKIQKGDVQPLLLNQDDAMCQTNKYPLQIV